MNKTIDLPRKNETEMCEILDSPPEVSFNNIVMLASKLLNTPYALISFVDGDRVWFKARVGIKEQEVKKEFSLCHIAIKQDEICVFEDITKNPVTKDLPICKLTYNIKFYCAIPLKNKNGINIGLLVIMDTKPRSLSAKETDVLKDLAAATCNQLELRLKLRVIEKEKNKLTLMLAHDVKNFISNIQSALPILVDSKNNGDNDTFNDLIGLLQSFTNKNSEIINQYINKVKTTEFVSDIQIKEVDFVKLVKEVVLKNKLSAKAKNQQLIFDSKKDKIIASLDEEKIKEAINNLINNAIKFSPFNSEIAVKINSNLDKIKIIDKGPGLSVEDLSKIFQVKTPLSAKPTGNEVSTGIGLWITNQIVESHGGKVYAQANCNGKGSKFSIELNCVTTQNNLN